MQYRDLAPFEEMLADLSAKYPEISKGYMFGRYMIKIDGKPFAVYYGDDFVFKLGPEHHDKILAEIPGAQRWEPVKGRVKKELVQIPAAAKAEWPRLAQYAIYYVTGGRFGQS